VTPVRRHLAADACCLSLAASRRLFVINAPLMFLCGTLPVGFYSLKREKQQHENCLKEHVKVEVPSKKPNFIQLASRVSV